MASVANAAARFSAAVDGATSATPTVADVTGCAAGVGWAAVPADDPGAVEVVGETAADAGAGRPAPCAGAAAAFCAGPSTGAAIVGAAPKRTKDTVETGRKPLNERRTCRVRLGQIVMDL